MLALHAKEAPNEVQFMGRNLTCALVLCSAHKEREEAVAVRTETPEHGRHRLSDSPKPKQNTTYIKIHQISGASSNHVNQTSINLEGKSI